MRIKQIYRLVCIGIIVASISGCGELEKLGGGSRSIAAGATAKECVYGIRAGKKLGFVIFTGITGASTSAGSSWAGHIKPKEGLAVQYEGDSGGLTINGTRYEFANGRVFLVATTSGTVSARQLNIPIGTAQYDVEIESISKQENIQEFLLR